MNSHEEFNPIQQALRAELASILQRIADMPPEVELSNEQLTQYIQTAEESKRDSGHPIVKLIQDIKRFNESLIEQANKLLQNSNSEDSDEVSQARFDRENPFLMGSIAAAQPESFIFDVIKDPSYSSMGLLHRDAKHISENLNRLNQALPESNWFYRPLNTLITFTAILESPSNDQLQEEEHLIQEQEKEELNKFKQEGMNELTDALLEFHSCKDAFTSAQWKMLFEIATNHRKKLKYHGSSSIEIEAAALGIKSEFHTVIGLIDTLLYKINSITALSLEDNEDKNNLEDYLQKAFLSLLPPDLSGDQLEKIQEALLALNEMKFIPEKTRKLQRILLNSISKVIEKYETRFAKGDYKTFIIDQLKYEAGEAPEPGEVPVKKEAATRVHIPSGKKEIDNIIKKYAAIIIEALKRESSNNTAEEISDNKEYFKNPNHSKQKAARKLIEYLSNLKKNFPKIYQEAKQDFDSITTSDVQNSSDPKLKQIALLKAFFYAVSNQEITSDELKTNEIAIETILVNETKQTQSGHSSLSLQSSYDEEKEDIRPAVLVEQETVAIEEKENIDLTSQENELSKAIKKVINVLKLDPQKKEIIKLTNAILDFDNILKIKDNLTALGDHLQRKFPGKSAAQIVAKLPYLKEFSFALSDAIRNHVDFQFKNTTDSPTQQLGIAFVRTILPNGFPNKFEELKNDFENLIKKIAALPIKTDSAVDEKGASLPDETWETLIKTKALMASNTQFTHREYLRQGGISDESLSEMMQFLQFMDDIKNIKSKIDSVTNGEIDLPTREGIYLLLMPSPELLKSASGKFQKLLSMVSIVFTPNKNNRNLVPSFDDTPLSLATISSIFNIEENNKRSNEVLDDSKLSPEQKEDFRNQKSKDAEKAQALQEQLKNTPSDASSLNTVQATSPRVEITKQQLVALNNYEIYKYYKKIVDALNESNINKAASYLADFGERISNKENRLELSPSSLDDFNALNQPENMDIVHFLETQKNSLPSTLRTGIHIFKRLTGDTHTPENNDALLEGVTSQTIPTILAQNAEKNKLLNDIRMMKEKYLKLYKQIIPTLYSKKTLNYRLQKLIKKANELNNTSLSRNDYIKSLETRQKAELAQEKLNRLAKAKRESDFLEERLREMALIFLNDKTEDTLANIYLEFHSACDKLMAESISHRIKITAPPDSDENTSSNNPVLKKKQEAIREQQAALAGDPRKQETASQRLKAYYEIANAKKHKQQLERHESILSRIISIIFFFWKAKTASLLSTTIKKPQTCYAKNMNLFFNGKEQPNEATRRRHSLSSLPESKQDGAPQKEKTRRKSI